MGKHILGVAAHPDDLEWYAGATIAKLAREGAEITFAICTNGDKGSYDPEVDPAELAQQRRKEQRAASDLLGICDVVFLGHPDGDLDAAMDLRAQLAQLYRETKPELLLAFDPWKEYELHPDHIAAGRAALEARLAAKMPLYLPELKSQGLAVWAIAEMWLFNANAPNLQVDVTDTMDSQLRALACHRSQPSVWDDAARQFLIHNAAENGRRIGVKYAEAFRRIVIEGALVLAEGTGS